MQAIAPGRQLLHSSCPHQQHEGLLHMWRQSLLRKQGEFTLSFGILPLCWTLGLALPTLVQRKGCRAGAGWHRGHVAASLVQCTRLCDCSGSLT